MTSNRQHHHPSPTNYQLPTKELHMTDVTNNRPLRSLPARPDPATCLQILASIAPSAAKTETLEAAAETLTIENLDVALAKTALGTDERMRYKFALAAAGIISK